MGNRRHRGQQHQPATGIRDVPTAVPSQSPMTQRFAIVTMRVPLRLDYPWKAGQPEIAQDILNHLSDALLYKDYVHGASSIKVVLIQKGDADAPGVGGDKLEDGLRDRGAQPTGDRGGQGG